MRNFLEYTLATLLWAAATGLAALYPLAIGIQIAQAAGAA
jgi:hypothetical protein